MRGICFRLGGCKSEAFIKYKKRKEAKNVSLKKAKGTTENYAPNSQSRSLLDWQFHSHHLYSLKLYYHYHRRHHHQHRLRHADRDRNDNIC